jgi:hypothetical protein
MAMSTWSRSRALLVLLGLAPLAAGYGPGWQQPVSPAAPTAGAAGLGVDVEYIEPQTFRDPGSAEQIYFPTKFVCGASEQSGRVVPASYETLINVINLSSFQARIGWFFVVVGDSITGAQALIPSRGSLAMDCDFIRTNLVLAGVAVDSFFEGFVLIEDLNGRILVRVAAVYSVLHKQLHDLPDLRPVETAASLCRLDDQRRLIVTIENVGQTMAPESVTRIAFAGEGTVSRATAALDPGEQVDLTPIPLGSGEGVHTFTITADFPKAVLEANEFNNEAVGRCTIIL